MTVSCSFYGAPGRIRTSGLLIRSQFSLVTHPLMNDSKSFVCNDSFSHWSPRLGSVSRLLSRHSTAFNKAIGTILGHWNWCTIGQEIPCHESCIDPSRIADSIRRMVYQQFKQRPAERWWSWDHPASNLPNLPSAQSYVLAGGSL